jgi:hypothetical protein
MRQAALSLLLFSILAVGQTGDPARSKRLGAEAALTADPQSALWKDAPAVTASNGPRGEPTPGHRTEIRSRWTPEFLYFLFVCPYEDLHVNTQPVTNAETNLLWQHDVAEVFIGADFEKFWQYREYQVSPKGEWVDLEIDTRSPKPEGGWRWNSGFQIAAKLDEGAKVWYGAMKIPVRSITEKPVKAGFEFRANFYRLQGPKEKKAHIAWRPTGRPNYHVPEAFGILRLEE